MNIKIEIKPEFVQHPHARNADIQANLRCATVVGFVADEIATYAVLNDMQGNLFEMPIANIKVLG